MNVCVRTVSSLPDPIVISTKKVIRAVTNRYLTLTQYDGTRVLRTLEAAQQTSYMLTTVL